jgi:hypothetical protein
MGIMKLFFLQEKWIETYLPVAVKFFDPAGASAVSIITYIVCPGLGPFMFHVISNVVAVMPTTLTAYGV